MDLEKVRNFKKYKFKLVDFPSFNFLLNWFWKWSPEATIYTVLHPKTPCSTKIFIFKLENVGFLRGHEYLWQDFTTLLQNEPPSSSILPCMLQTQDNMFTEALTETCHKSTWIMQLELCRVVSYFSPGTCPYQKPNSGQSEAQSIKKSLTHHGLKCTRCFTVSLADGCG